MSKDAESRRPPAGEGEGKVTGDAASRSLPSGRSSGKEKEREERLAAALRENLRKRKAQARARSVRKDASSGEGDN